MLEFSLSHSLTPATPSPLTTARPSPSPFCPPLLPILPGNHRLPAVPSPFLYHPPWLSPQSPCGPRHACHSPPVTILPPSSLCQPLSPATPLTHPSQPPGDNLCHLPTAAHVPAPDVRRRLKSAWPLWAGNGCPSLNCILTPEL